MYLRFIQVFVALTHVPTVSATEILVLLVALLPRKGHVIAFVLEISEVVHASASILICRIPVRKHVSDLSAGNFGNRHGCGDQVLGATTAQAAISVGVQIFSLAPTVYTHDHLQRVAQAVE